MKKAQIGIEYLIIMSFVVIIVMLILGIALFYSGSIKDRIKITQVNNCANEIISESESVFYSGQPSKSTVSCYLPDNVKLIEVIENSLIFTIQTNSGITRTGFSSNVPISGNIPAFFGLRKIQLKAEQNYTLITLL